MKKVKWIALALVLCLGLIGGAYAAWTDFVTVAGTAEAGEMEVVVGQNSAAESGRYDEMVIDRIWNNEKGMTIIASKLYPRLNYGQEADDYMKLMPVFRNDGTAPAGLDSVSVRYDGGNQALYNKLRVTAVYNGTEFWTGYLKDIGNMSGDIVPEEVIEPNENSEELLELELYLWLCETADNPYQNLTTSFDVEFHFAQPNLAGFFAPQ